MWAKNTRPDAPDEAMLVDDTPLTSPDRRDDYPGYFNDAYSPSDLRNDLLNDGSRWKSDGHRETQCMTCGDWIDLGKVDTGKNALVNHEGKRRCLAKVESNRLVRESAAAADALDDLRRSATFSPHTPRHPQRFTSMAYAPISPPSFIGGSGSSM